MLLSHQKHSIHMRTIASGCHIELPTTPIQCIDKQVGHVDGHVDALKYIFICFAYLKISTYTIIISITFQEPNRANYAMNDVCEPAVDGSTLQTPWLQ